MPHKQSLEVETCKRNQKPSKHVLNPAGSFSALGDLLDPQTMRTNVKTCPSPSCLVEMWSGCQALPWLALQHLGSHRARQKGSYLKFLDFK